MPKIRKKTSKRQSVSMREKVKKKVSESHRKAKKQAKKDPTWKSKKPKELGIPSKFPFKEQLLAEAAADKQRLEEEKAARREAMKAAANPTLASTAALASAMAAESDNMAMEEDDLDANVQEAMVQDPSLKLHARSLRKVLELSDVIVEVLDARDPVGTRCKAVERELKSLDGGRKRLVIVLNKIDLVPQSVVQSWLAHLRTQAPTLPFKSSTQQQRNHLSSSSNGPSSAAGSSVKPLMELIKGFRLAPSSQASTSNTKVGASLTIGVIGHPNVGKSSLINTLKRSKACAVAPTPGWTKEVQEITLEKGIRILDCPGVVVESRSQVEGALRGVVKPEELDDVRAPIELMLERCKKQHLMMLYNIPMFATTIDFLIEVARAKGRLRKGGVPDLDGTARSILRDWTAGRIPYFVPPPQQATPATTNGSTTNGTSTLGTVSSSDVGSASIATTLAPAFDLDALFGEADRAAFEQAGSSSNGSVSVKMQGIEDDEDANIGWIAEDDDEQDDEAIDVADLVDDDDDALDFEDDAVGEDIDMADAVSSTKTANKSSSMNGIVSMAPKKAKAKRVSFASEHLGPTASGQRAKMFGSNADENVEMPSALNKNVKKAAKKDKKAAAKKERRAVQAVEQEEQQDAEQDGEMTVAAPRRVATTVQAKGNIGEAYDFSEFFPQEAAM